MEIGQEITRKAVEALSSYVLCPSCLGRLFSSYLKGFTNRERGIAILTTIMLNLHKRLEEGDPSSIKLIERVSRSLPPSFKSFLDSLGIKHEEAPECYVCGSLMDNLDIFVERGSELLRELRAESFVVGVTNDDELIVREDEVWRKLAISGAESIRNEIKRETGKRIQLASGVPVDFNTPGAIVILDVRARDVIVVSNPILIAGRYLKLGRNISQAVWIDRDDRKLYPFSIEEAANLALDYTKGGRIIVHAAGREDVDVRMLGTGRPVVLEIKEPRRRNVSPRALQDFLNARSRWVKFQLAKRVSRQEVRATKLSDKTHRKVYRALIYVDEGLSIDDVSLLEREFFNREVKQRTPTRVLSRRPDMLRAKKVFWVRGRLLSDRWMEAFIAAEGGLYIKELVSGDEGRTSPSFSEVLSRRALCIELDVLQVLSYHERVETH